MKRPFSFLFGASLAAFLALPAGAQTLIHRYSFNGNAADSVGGASGTVVGSVTWHASSGVNGGADFGGGTSGNAPGFVRLPTSVVSSLQNATVEIFTTNFNPPGSGTGVPGGQYETLFSAATPYGNQSNFINLTPDFAGVGLGFSAQRNGANAGSAVGHDPFPVWRQNHIVALVFSGFKGVGTSGTVLLYLDGAEVARTTTTDTFAALAAAPGGISVVGIGGGSPFNDPTYSGSIDEVRIFNSSLNPDKLAAEVATGPAVVGAVSVTGFSPASINAGASGFTLTLHGTGFTPASTVAFGTDTGVKTTFLDPTTLSVAVPAADVSTAQSVSVKAATPSAGGGQTFTRAFTVLPTAVTVKSLSLSPTSVAGGSSSTATLTLTAAAPSGGLAVPLKSSDTSAATVASTLNIAAGATSAKFKVTTKGVTGVKAVTITATSGSTSKTATLTVNAPGKSAAP